MESYMKHIVRGLVLSTAVWATACSEVSFEPGADQRSLTLPDGSQKEVFTFDDDGAQAKVDVLFVVDNSASMLEEQALLGDALNSFITGLGRIDWQIGVTTTDTSNGTHGVKGSLVPMKGTGGQKILTKNTPNFANIFKSTVNRDEVTGCNNVTVMCPSSDERPLEAISMAVAKRNSDNAGFFRDGADLAVVILSDEDERSNGAAGALTAVALNAAVNLAFGGSKTFSAYGIVIEPNDSACLSANASGPGYYGLQAAALALLTGGVTGSICDSDFGPALESIGNRVKDLVKSVSLQYTPDPSTVQLIMSPFDSSLTWTIEGNQIRFNKSPKKGTRIEVVYLPKP